MGREGIQKRKERTSAPAETERNMKARALND